VWVATHLVNVMQMGEKPSSCEVAICCKSASLSVPSEILAHSSPVYADWWASAAAFF
jgi:hypothetical protein